GSLRPVYAPPPPKGFAARSLLRGGDAAMRLIAVFLFFALWSIISVANKGYEWFPAVLFPPPWEILQEGFNMLLTGELFRHIRDSLIRVAQGFGIGAFLGISTGLVIGRWRLAEQFLETILEMLRPIPPLAFLPLMVLWLGIGETSKITFIAYTEFFPVFTTTAEGIKYVDPLLIRAAASLGASERDLFRYVILPAALPNIIVGLRLGFALAFFVIVAAEFIAADTGLGYLINDARTFFLVPRMLLGALVIGALGWFFNWLLKVLERKLIPYRKQTRGTGSA
ncbi:MAG: ABC transporter permease, partial [Chloroflexi bacterium]|nr:ABC transporter permease [Chloroflexota bacterium]